jgi:hypothetical protein
VIRGRTGHASLQAAVQSGRANQRQSSVTVSADCGCAAFAYNRFFAMLETMNMTLGFGEMDTILRDPRTH